MIDCRVATEIREAPVVAYVVPHTPLLCHGTFSCFRIKKEPPTIVIPRYTLSKKLLVRRSWRYMISSTPASKSHRGKSVHVTALDTVVDHQALETWKDKLYNGQVVEVWYKEGLQFAIVKSTEKKAVRVVHLRDGESILRKVDYGEVVGIWPEALGTSDDRLLGIYVKNGLELIRSSKPRTLNMTRVYNELRMYRKGDARGTRQSYQLASSIFPLAMSENKDRQAAATAATAILISKNDHLFKRAPPGQGWCAFPPSVVESKIRESFIATAKRIIAAQSSKINQGGAAEELGWSYSHNEILRSLEIAAASGSNASGTAKTILRMLGYPVSGYGSAEFLYAIGYWSKSTDGHGDIESDRVTGVNGGEATAPKGRTNSMAELLNFWSCSQEILTEADEIRSAARRRRSGILKGAVRIPGYRRSIYEGIQSAVYCIDEHDSRFFDDAISVEHIGDESLIRLSLHIADVDESIKPGSPIDMVAKKRGKSLYFPLNPLHMFPAKAMEASSFSSSYPTEAITVSIELDTKKQKVLAWEIYASVVPPVRCLTYKEFDRVLSSPTQTSVLIDEPTRADLLQIAQVVPIIASTFDRRCSRGADTGNIRAENGKEGKIASIRLVRPKGSGKRGEESRRGAVVREFRTDGAHAVVASLLASVGAIFRMYASQNGVALPEQRGAEKFASRCGTAPLRRYADLAVQRQVKALLMHRQPAGRRRMQELRVWLAKRSNEGDRAVATQRRNALYDSFAAHCEEQKRASGLNYALIMGRVKSSSLQRKRVPRADVLLESTGITASATLSKSIAEATRGIQDPPLPVGTQVRVKISSVNLKTLHIRAEIVERVYNDSG